MACAAYTELLSSASECPDQRRNALEVTGSIRLERPVVKISTRSFSVIAKVVDEDGIETRRGSSMNT